MGDTQRSPTISPENQGIAEQEVPGNVRGGPNPTGDRPPALSGQTSLEWIKVKARDEPQLVFTSLVHLISFDLLKRSYRQVRKSKSCGVEGVTAAEYAEHLDTNIYNLLLGLQRGQYVAQPVKRIWIDKEGGKKRPIGFSHGFREGHSQHMALHELREQCWKQNINWIIDADVCGYFYNIDKKLLGDIIRQRVNDGGLLRLVGKWLKAGVDESGELSYPESGIPQGAVICPC